MKIMVPVPTGVDPLSEEGIQHVVDSIVKLADEGRIPRCPPADSIVWARTSSDHALADVGRWRRAIDGTIVEIYGHSRANWGGPTMFDRNAPDRWTRWTYAAQDVRGETVGWFYVEDLFARYPRRLDREEVSAMRFLHALFYFIEVCTRRVAS